ncbi:hypothetical protein D9756_005415 [Leucocoprinus leucothites]|uniref:Velvet domain-containing protein n=1 Tax=Leucocoprinus leucothites TaxID=201217 RepID=A0A8H5D7Y0_9AGAR|nr:hypothetical protein D9756_005415 [Leucoagaricus leucothites]
MAFQPQYQDQHHALGANGGAFVNQPGLPITFITGQFEGNTIRVELEELQKADSGRKYAKVDRRPLDPPPAILLRLFRISNPSPDKIWEREVDNYEEIKNIGILCGVDLFPVPDKILDSNIPIPPSTAASHIPQFGAYTPSQASSSPASSPGARNVQPRASRVSPAQALSPFDLTNSGTLKLNYAAPNSTVENSYTYFPLHPFTTPSAESGGPSARVSPFQIPRRQPMLGQLNEAEPPSDIVLRIGNHLVTESSKLTPALVGEKFVEPTLIDYKGRKCLVFVFGVRLPLISALVQMIQGLRLHLYFPLVYPQTVLE